MVAVAKELEDWVNQLSNYLESTDEKQLTIKPAPDKWSKKEILGHLIDSGINNLQRFTEIQFERQPFKLRNYKQEELVKANNYQNTNLTQLTNLLRAINHQINTIISIQNSESLKLKIITPGKKIIDLKFLIEDYLAHFKHHALHIIE